MTGPWHLALVPVNCIAIYYCNYAISATVVLAPNLNTVTGHALVMFCFVQINPRRIVVADSIRSHSPFFSLEQV